MADPALFPGNSISTADTTDKDLSAPLDTIVKGLDLMEDADKPSGFGPFKTSTGGSAILESTATGLSKWIGALVATLGGASAIATAAGAFWTDQKQNVQIGFIGGGGAVVLGAFLTLGWIVSADLRARATGQVAMYQARQAIALKFLDDSYAAAAATRTAAENKAERDVRVQCRRSRNSSG